MHKMHKHAPFPPAQSRPHLRTVKRQLNENPFREAWTRRSVTSDNYAAP